MTTTHYDTVGAARDASATQLRRAYLQRARQLHPDQFVDRPAPERARAERRMQELNAAWTVLSDPDTRRTYDTSLGLGRSAGTGPIVSGRNDTWHPFDQERPTTPERATTPQVANERDMEIRGPAKLLRPLPLLALFVSLVLLVVLASLVSGGDTPEADTGPTPLVAPTGTPIGCINLLPVAEEVPCGGHDAVVWTIVGADEACPAELEAAYRQGRGGLFCLTRVG